MRVNARLDEDRTQKLEFLIRATNLATSEIVKRALDVYYDHVTSARPRAAEILREVGFIGCGDAAPELSTEYKEELRHILAAKHDHR